MDETNDSGVTRDQEQIFALTSQLSVTCTPVTKSALVMLARARQTSVSNLIRQTLPFLADLYPEYEGYYELALENEIDKLKER